MKTLSLEESVRFALASNPQLAALREQRGIAAAGVVIAKTYPFNPIYQGSLASAHNSIPGQVFNTGPVTNQVTLDLQVMHQQRYRQQAAFAAVTRTEWEIATQEQAYAIAAVRAFDGYIHRYAKLVVTEEYLKLSQTAVDQVKLLVDSGTLKSSDLILARTEISDIQSQVGLNRVALNAARRDFYRALGATNELRPIGTLERTGTVGNADQLLAAAMELRPERFARLAAVAEADADIRLQRADRFGNPQIGPSYDLNETRTSFVGVKVQVPIPVLNRKRGEIQQAEAKKAQALQYVRQTDVEIKQDVLLSVDRLEETRKLVEIYKAELIPSLQKSLADMEQLFRQGQAGVDVLRIIDVRRKLLKAQDGYVDALLAYTSALADLAAAVGDPSLAIGSTVGKAKP